MSTFRYITPSTPSILILGAKNKIIDLETANPITHVREREREREREIERERDEAKIKISEKVKIYFGNNYLIREHSLTL